MGNTVVRRVRGNSSIFTHNQVGWYCFSKQGGDFVGPPGLPAPSPLKKSCARQWSATLLYLHWNWSKLNIYASFIVM